MSSRAPTGVPEGCVATLVADRPGHRRAARAGSVDSEMDSAPRTTRPTVLPAAVLWDFDGTLADSERYWIAEEYALVAEYGGTWTDADAHALVGNDLLVSGAYLRKHGPVPLGPADIVARLVAGVRRRLSEAVPWRAGVVSLRAGLAAAGVPQAMVTMSYATVVDPVLAAVAAAGMPGFDTVVTGEQVRRGKPDPEPYLTAAERLGVDPRRCVAIEDSRTGAVSASAAGCAVLVVPNAVPVEPAPGWRVLPTGLAGVTTDDLAALLAAPVA